MKECAVNRERAVIANHQMPEVAEPREGALDFPAPAVAPQRSSVLGHRFASIPAMRGDQFDPALSQPLSQRVTVVTTIGDQAERFLSRPPPRFWREQNSRPGKTRSTAVASVR